jgi:hypothetical protein
VAQKHIYFVKLPYNQFFPQFCGFEISSDFLKLDKISQICSPPKNFQNFLSRGQENLGGQDYAYNQGFFFQFCEVPT